MMRLYSTLVNREWLEAWEKFEDREITDLGTYKKRYRFVELNQVVAISEELGLLLHKRLIEIGVIDALFHEHVLVAWEKLKPIIGEVKRIYGAH